jgi:uncharacterized membrane protein YqhA
MLWQTIIHVVFLVSAVSIALIDRIMVVSLKPTDHGNQPH